MRDLKKEKILNYNKKLLKIYLLYQKEFKDKKGPYYDKLKDIDNIKVKIKESIINLKINIMMYGK